MNPEYPTTTDSFYHGQIKIRQLKKGYRFAVDSPILADFLPVSDSPGLEIGCGVGVISLLALFLKKFPAITAIEIQEPLYRLAKANARENGLTDRLTIRRGDFNAVYADFKNTTTVFSNPPFLKTNQGPISPNESIKLARFEIALTLEALLSHSAEILGPVGNLYLIFAFKRKDELFNLAKEKSLHPVKFRLVRAFSHSLPDRFLVQLSKKKRDLFELEPLTIFDSQDRYTAELERILAGKN